MAKGALAIGSDHAGRHLKKAIIARVESLGYTVQDYGVDCDDGASVHYPDFAQKIASSVSDGTAHRGIAICGTGLGMCIAVNKFPGVRATSVWNEMTAKMARMHNNANILCLGERLLGEQVACSLTGIWLETPFQGGRHQMRLDMIAEIEGQNFRKK